MALDEITLSRSRIEKEEGSPTTAFLRPAPYLRRHAVGAELDEAWLQSYQSQAISDKLAFGRRWQSMGKGRWAYSSEYS